jgi:hypothetical protein
VVAPGESARLRKVPAFGPSPAMAHVVSLRSTPCAIAPLSSWNRGEDVQEVGYGKQFGLPFLHPSTRRSSLTLRAMAVPAAVVGNNRVRAVFTARDMSPESCGAAALDGTHHLQLGNAHMACVGGTPCRSVIAEDICDFQSRPSQHYWRPITPAACPVVSPVG